MAAPPHELAKVSEQPLSPLGIIAGGGLLPVEIAEIVSAAGRPVFIAGIEGQVDPRVARWPHGIFHLGKLGALFNMLKAAGCIDLVIAGRAERPDISALRLDGKGLRSLPRILSILVGGDDTVLTGLIRFIEEHEFRVVGAHEVAPALVMRNEIFGSRHLARHFRDDLDVGLQALDRLGNLDAGQALIVIDRRIVAIEAAEGTDRMIARVSDLRDCGRIRTRPGRGVLVKAPKPGQELRVDMPAIGPDTVKAVKTAGLGGIGLAADGVIVANRSEVKSLSSALGVFVAGLGRDG